ncbi:MAG: DoxX family protein [Spirochaetota bacterium]
MLKRFLKKILPNEDLTDLFFRVMFSSIFLGLGMEHLFQDEILQKLMPEWFEWILPKRIVSICTGLVLLFGGSSILLGYKIRLGALVLASFLVLVNASIHFLGVVKSPDTMPANWHWLWDAYQRSNLVKNICLLGVCLHLLYYQPRKYSLENFLKNR